jgi:ABC-2 type transport system permease protein
MAIGGMLGASLRAAAILILGTWMFHVPFAVTSLSELFAVFMLSMAALYGLGMLFASLFLLWGRNAFQMSAVLQEPVYFLSGFYFPVKNFGVAMATVVSVIPLTLGLDAIRQLIFATGPSIGFLSVRSEVGLLAVMAAVFVAGAKYWLDRMEKLAVREGALTDRRR